MTFLDKLTQKWRNRSDLAKYRVHAHPKTYDWKWEEKGFNRIALVNHLLSATQGAQSAYLEIGCASNSLFNSVACLDKTGVDPASGGTHRMTSDAFFAANTRRFDVIFIDGLHEYAQVRRDALNALAVLKDGGWIAFHDFLPADWQQHHVPRLSPAWTGDCWKLAVELREATGLAFRIVEIDHGVGLIQKTSDTLHIPDLSESLAPAQFDRFVAELDSLPLCSFQDAIAFVGNTPIKRAAHV
ncbi:class I SAM-dependent methyltransferase [Shimia sp. FJ5]|uniref:class I SAM-dependent methyltransferase n=1 Tax=Shimia sp. FJ5 TaxID=3079054 RepID=UPI00262E2D8B|nr:class I SAM-dependent methyltransferase [Shimia sp. FJ5]MDV4144122.1 class I SAM-dependent methyltransferase [Shimia sp. FJ5]